MPAAGRKPNEGQPVRHRVKPVHEWTEIEDVPFAGAPPLPDTEPGRVTWPTQTQNWWEAISTMPHCVVWTKSDWRFAIDTAYVAQALHLGEVKAATELRQREKIMGTTLDARRDLRIRYVPPGTHEATSAGVIAIGDYQDRLAGPTATKPRRRRPANAQASPPTPPPTPAKLARPARKRRGK